MAKKASAAAAAGQIEQKPTAAGPGAAMSAPVTLEKALESIKGACDTMGGAEVVYSQIRVLRVLCDAADGSADAAASLASVRGSLSHGGELSLRGVRVEDLQNIRSAIVAKSTPPAVPASEAAADPAAV